MSMEELAARVAQPDLASLPDWKAAEILNAPDASFPEIIERASFLCGYGTILEILGPENGAIFLDDLTAMSDTNPSIKWALRILANNNMDLSHENVRQNIDWLASQGKMTTSQASAFKALGEKRRFPSWSEIHNVEVTARTVGLARGGI